MKIIATEIKPEYIESPFWYDYSDHNNGTTYDDLLIISDEFKGKTNELFDLITENAEEAYEVSEDFRVKGGYYSPYFKNYTDYIMQIFNPGRRLSTKAIHELKELFKEISEAYSPEYASDEIAEAMTIIGGKEYKTRRLIGYCQGDVVTAIYKPSEWTDKALESVETEYWNGGREYRLEDAETGEDFYNMYFTDWDEEHIKAEIAAEMGTTPESVTLENYW